MIVCLQGLIEAYELNWLGVGGTWAAITEEFSTGGSYKVSTTLQEDDGSNYGSFEVIDTRLLPYVDNQQLKAFIVFRTNQWTNHCIFAGLDLYVVDSTNLFVVRTATRAQRPRYPCRHGVHHRGVTRSTQLS